MGNFDYPPPWFIVINGFLGLYLFVTSLYMRRIASFFYRPMSRLTVISLVSTKMLDSGLRHAGMTIY